MMNCSVHIWVLHWIKLPVIAYVIDTTGSMTEELPEIQATIPQIRTNLQQYVDSFSGNIQVRFILVPFNDPGNYKYIY